jgi:hypothetical protein
MDTIYVIKGEIRDFTPIGNKGEIREGALHFLPKEEIFINTNRKNWEDAYSENRINVVGKNKSGQFKHSKLHFKYLVNLRIEEIQNPSSKTLEFIKKVGLFSFHGGSSEQELALKILKLIEEFNRTKNG